MYEQNLNTPIRLRRDDGGDNADNTQNTENPQVSTQRAARGAYLLGELIGGPQRRRAGLNINGTFFPLSDILSFATLLILLIVAFRKR